MSVPCLTFKALGWSPRTGVRVGQQQRLQIVKESGERMRVGVGWYVEHMYKTCMHKNARGFLNVLWRELPTFPKF